MNRIAQQLAPLLAILALNLTAVAQEEPLQFNRITIDSEQLPQLLKSRSLVPIKKNEFEQRLETATNQIAPREEVTVDRAVYTASLGDDELSGTFQLQLPEQDQSNDSVPAWVFLGKPNFNAMDLQDSAAWGRDAANNAIARRPSDSSVLEGTWSLKGRKRRWGTELVFRPITALASELTLTLPATLRLETDSDVTTRPIASGTETKWLVTLRSQSQATLRIIKPQTFQRPPIADVRTTWSVQKETTQFRTEISLQTTEPLSRFSVLLPPATAIESVFYGDNTPVPIEIIDTTTGRELKVNLPRPITTAGRRLAITARLPIIVGTDWAIPRFDRIRCELDSESSINAIARRITHSVFIQSPLELQELKLNGFKQSNSVFQTDGSQTLALTRVFDDGNATLRVGEAKRARQYRVATSLLNDQDVWQQRTLIISDTPFPDEIQLRLPPDLTILAITSGMERTPCDFRIENGVSNQVRVFVPPTTSTMIEVSGQTDNSPSGTTAPVDGNVITNLLIVPTETFDESGQSAVPLRQFRSDFGSYPDADFVRGSSTIVACEPGEIVKLKPAVTLSAATDTDKVQTDPVSKPSNISVTSMALTSTIRTRPSPDIHEARIRVTTTEPLVRFELADSANLLSVETNGTRLRPIRTGTTVVVPINPSAASNQIVIRYTCAARDGSVLKEQRTVPVPEFCEARDFTWTILTPPDFIVVNTTPFGSEPARPTNAGKLLGPLRVEEVPSGPTQITMPYVPAALSLTVSSRESRRQCGWIALTGAAIVSLFLATRIAPIWMCAMEAVLALLAIVLPDPIGTICGGCLLGGLFGLAMANLLRQPIRTKTSRHSKSGSIRPSAITSVLLLTAFLPTSANVSGQEQQSNVPRVYEISNQDMVYVDRQLLQELEGTIPKSHNLLIHNARYVVSIAGGSVSVKVKLEALLMDATQPTSVSFPFAAANVSRCLVDGQQVDFTKRAKDIQLTVPALDSEAADSTVLIELELYPAMRNGGCQFAIAPAAKSTCEIKTESDIDARLNGLPCELNTPNPVTDEIDIVVQNPGSSPTPQTPATISSDCLIELGASETTFDHTVVVTPGTQPVAEFELQFPASHRFTSLTTDQPSVQQVVPAGATTFVLVRFAEPLLVPTSIRLRLASVKKSSSAKRSIRLEPVVDGLANVTVQTRPGLLLEDISWTDNQEAASQSIKTNRNRSAAFSISGPGQLTYRLKASDAVRNLKLNQRIHVSANEMDYVMEGDLNIEDGPVFAHALTVTPDLLIESIQVRENGVDRLTRYQRDGDRLLLFLEGRTSGTQIIKLEGRLPLETDKPTSLPQTTVQGARFEQSTLVLSRDSDVNVTLLNNNGIPFAVRPDTALTDSLESGEATFELLEFTEFPQIKTQLVAPMSADAICFQRETSDGKSSWTWAYRIGPGSDQRTVQLHPNGGTIQVPTVATANDDLVSLELSEDDIIVVQFEGTDAVIPEPIWRELKIQSRTLALLKDDSIRLNAGKQSDQPLPNWASDLVEGDILLFDDSTPWQLEVQQAEDTPGTESPVVEQIETTLWQRDSTLAGKSTMLLQPTSGAQLEMQLPLQSEIRSVESDGQVIEFKTASDQLFVPCSNARELTVRWTMPLLDESFSVPAPFMESGEMLFAFLPKSPEVTIASTDLANITRDDYIANRRIKSNLPPETATLFLGRISSPTRAGQRLQLVSASRSTPLFGMGLLCAAVVFGATFSASILRTRNRVPFLLTGTAILLIATTGSLPVAISLMLIAAGTWWYIPRQM